MLRDLHGASSLRFTIGSLTGLALLAAVAGAQGFEESPYGNPQLLTPTIWKLVPVVAGDLDGDGLPDLLARAADSDSVLVFINDAGTFGTGSPYSAPTFYSLGLLQRHLLADLDGDGSLDALFADGIVGQIQTMRNHGDGTLEPVAVAAGLPLGTQDMSAADMDGDGLRDLVAGTGAFSGAGKLMLLHGQGDGTFAPAQQVGSPPAVGMVGIADLDGVGGLDVVTQTSPFATAALTGFDVFLGAGDGAFVHAPSVPSGAFLPSTALDVSDLDGDTRLDIVTATPNEALVALGHGDGSFDPLLSIPIPGGSVYNAQVVDVDADGYADLVGGGTSYAQRLGPGLQLVGDPVLLDFEKIQILFTLADFDGDALVDLAWAGHDDHAHVDLDVLGPFIDVGYDGPPGLLTLSVEGTPQAGEEGTLLIGGPHPGMPAVLVVGLHPAHTQLFGLDLVPEVGALLPASVGTAIHGRWPETLQPGMLLYFQAFVVAMPGPALSQAIVVVPD